MIVFFVPVINYEVTVVTGDVFAGGTNANVFLQMYGDQGKTELLTLKSRSNNYERGTTEIFKVILQMGCSGSFLWLTTSNHVYLVAVT